MQKPTWIRVSMLGTKDMVFMSQSQANSYIKGLAQNRLVTYALDASGRYATSSAPADDIPFVKCKAALYKWTSDAFDSTGQRIEGWISRYYVVG